MIFDYAETPHDRVARQMFGDDPMTQVSRDRLPCVIMAFVNRSGSNYLADVLKSTGMFAGFEEVLNDVVMNNLAPRYGVNTLADYIERVRREQLGSQAVIWGLKAGSSQLGMLLRYGVLQNLLAPTVIFVRRRDVLGQAISFAIAEQTQQWTALDVERTKEVNYNSERILLHFRSMLNSYAAIEQILLMAQVPTIVVTYEDLLDRPNSVVSDIGQQIMGQPLLPRLDRLRLSQQRNDLNYEFRCRFLKEAAYMTWRVR